VGWTPWHRLSLARCSLQSLADWAAAGAGDSGGREGRAACQPGRGSLGVVLPRALLPLACQMRCLSPSTVMCPLYWVCARGGAATHHRRSSTRDTEPTAARASCAGPDTPHAPGTLPCATGVPSPILKKSMTGRRGGGGPRAASKGRGSCSAAGTRRRGEEGSRGARGPLGSAETGADKGGSVPRWHLSSIQCALGSLQTQTGAPLGWFSSTQRGNPWPRLPLAEALRRGEHTDGHRDFHQGAGTAGFKSSGCRFPALSPLPLKLLSGTLTDL